MNSLKDVVLDGPDRTPLSVTLFLAGTMKLQTGSLRCSSSMDTLDLIQRRPFDQESSCLRRCRWHGPPATFTDHVGLVAVVARWVAEGSKATDTPCWPAATPYRLEIVALIGRWKSPALLPDRPGSACIHSGLHPGGRAELGRLPYAAGLRCPRRCRGFDADALQRLSICSGVGARTRNSFPGRIAPDRPYSVIGLSSSLSCRAGFVPGLF